MSVFDRSSRSLAARTSLFARPMELLEHRLLLASTPLGGTPLPIATTGATTIEAENFDNGGEGVAYHDTDAGNIFKTTDRAPTDVDVYDVALSGGGKAVGVGWTKPTEYLNYTVSVASAGSYKLAINTASVGAGGMFHLEVDGQNVTGPLAAPDTSDWLTFQTVNGGTINLTAGTHVLKLVFDSSQQANGYMANFDNFTLTAVAPPANDGTPFGGSPVSVAATGSTTLEVENFNIGGEGVAYHDTDAGNVFTTTDRAPTDVDIYDVALSGGGKAVGVGWVKAGEWLKYTVTVPTAGTYHLGINTASVGAGGAFHLEVDGQKITSTLNAPDTGDWLTFQTVDGGAFGLTAGTHVLRLVFDASQQTNGYMANFNNFTLTAVPLPGQVSNPTPATGSTVSSSPAVLGWTAGSNATSYDVTLDGTLVGNVTTPQYTVPTTLASGLHTWSVTAKNAAGNTAGPAWTFTVGTPAPGLVSNPSPANGSTVSSPAQLSWTAASNAQSYDVYLDGVLQGNVTTPQYTVAGTLTAAVHQWNVVAKNATSNTTGPTWNFTVTSTAAVDGTPFGGTAPTITATGVSTLEVENFNVGASGVAYSDTDAGDVFGSTYRPGTDVDVYNDTTTSSNGHGVGWTKATEWLKYTVNVASAGTYSIGVRVASVGAGGNFHVEVDGTNVTGTMSAPDTGGWLTYQTVTSPGFSLTAGQHTLRLVMDSSQQANGYMANFDTISLSHQGAQPDLQIRAYGDTTYQGSNFISSTGQFQSPTEGTNFFPQIYQARVQNNGTVADSFNITGPGDIPPNWHVWYFPDQIQGYPGAPQVTSQVENGGWNTGLIQPGQYVDFRFEVGPTANDPANDTYQVTVTAASASNPGLIDVVKPTTINQVRREVEIRRRNVTAPGPYAMDIQNEGNASDSYTISGTGNGTGYTVNYFDDAAMTHDVTTAVVAGTYVTPTLAHLGLQTLVVKITPTDGQTHSVTINAVSTGDNTIIATGNISTAAPPAAPPIFTIGVWSQPAYSFQTWAQRGINTVVNYDSYGGTDSLATWSQVAVDKGLYMIRQPADNPADDLHQANLLAWMQPDEPELRSGFSAANAVSNYNTWKSIAPNIPVWENFAGGYVMDWQGSIAPSTYQAYAQGADWISSGTYPLSGWARPEDLDVSGRTLDRLQTWTGGKPQFAVIESAPQNGNWLPKGFPGANAMQVRAELWDSVIKGAQGIVYFPQSFNPTFSYDNTPPDVVTEMTTQNARLAALGPALVSSIDPPTLGLATPAPLEGTWRTYGGKNYFIVLNMSGNTLTNQQMTLRGTAGTTAVVQGESRSVNITGGVITDNFAPYEAHVYVVG